MEYYNNKPRLKTLSTANREGKVDVAYFGSAQMTDEKTVVIGFGAQPIFRQSSRESPFANLQENPYALKRHSGESRNPVIPAYSGCRIKSGKTNSKVFAKPAKFGNEEFHISAASSQKNGQSDRKRN